MLHGITITYIDAFPQVITVEKSFTYRDPHHRQKNIKPYAAPETLSEPTDHTKKNPLSSLAMFLVEAQRTLKYLIQVKICSSHIMNYKPDSNCKVMDGCLLINYPQ